MDISFILSLDELFTLISLSGAKSDAGKHFVEEALPGAAFCDTNGLVEKKFAKMTDGELDLVPVLRMVADAIAKANSIVQRGEGWDIRSPWVSLHCERSIYCEGHMKITPMKGEAV